MTDLVIVRHAQSVWNAEGRWQGWADPPLSAWGEQQASAAGDALRAAPAPDLIAASDLRRARRTAELLAAGLRGNPPGGPGRSGPDGDAAGPAPGAVEILIDPDLREYDTGHWTGLRRVDIAQRWPDQLAEWEAGRVDRAPGGEDHTAFVNRLLGALERIRQAAPGGRVLAVSHGRAIHALALALGAPGGRVDHLTGWRLRLGPAPVLVSAVSLMGVAAEPGAADDRRQDL